MQLDGGGRGRGVTENQRQIFNENGTSLCLFSESTCRPGLKGPDQTAWITQPLGMGTGRPTLWCYRWSVFVRRKGQTTGLHASQFRASQLSQCALVLVSP